MKFVRFHRPRIYRYAMADKGVRLVRNLSGSVWIGQVAVIGRYAYCVKWADNEVR